MSNASTTTTTIASTGNIGCPCIDASKTLASLQKRSCITSSNSSGVLLTPESASCVPSTYGSNSCLQHDLLHNIVCQDLDETKTFCLRNWCYVDLQSCKLNSTERVYRSEYFGSSQQVFFQEEAGIDLYYSYTTCNSTGADWEAYKKEEATIDYVLGNIAIVSTPIYVIYPMVFKNDANSVNLGTGSPEYKDDSVPFEGVYIDYAEELMRVSNGDIAMINYTHRSNAADLGYPSSPGTATVQDVADGLIDMAIGPFWITGERLKMTAFTVPLVYDKTVLVIQNPGSQRSILSESAKVAKPFKPGLIGISGAIILTSAVLSLWFSNRNKLAEQYGKSLRDLQSNKRNVGVYGRLALDSVLQKSMFFFGAAVEQDARSPLSTNILMFGFGFFILIAVSAYVANLAAFLTRSQTTYVGTMQAVVDAGLRICAHPALQKELEIKWPDARFVFSTTGNEFNGVLDDYDAGKCAVLAIGKEDTLFDSTLMEKFCQRELVFTDSLILETPIAFPIKPELVSGMSYWILEAEKYHSVSIENSKVKYSPHLSCNVELAQEEDLGDYAQISVLNMILPIMVFTWCALIAITVHICGWGKSWELNPQTVIKKISMLDSRKARHNQDSFHENSCEMPINNVTFSDDLRASNSNLNGENLDQEAL